MKRRRKKEMEDKEIIWTTEREYKILGESKKIAKKYGYEIILEEVVKNGKGKRKTAIPRLRGK
jgi:hypothetical protein